jgi:hypothetical protein
VISFTIKPNVESPEIELRRLEISFGGNAFLCRRVHLLDAATRVGLGRAGVSVCRRLRRAGAGGCAEFGRWARIPAERFLFDLVRERLRFLQASAASGHGGRTHDRGSTGLNIPIWQTGERRQDIAWDQPFMYTWTECGASITLDVTAKTAHSFVVDSQMDWVNPTACATLAWLGVPPSDCTVHQHETFELEQACPATRDGLSCQ